MAEHKSNQYRILVKPGDKATVVVYPGAGFSDKADENYKADCASSEGASTYLAEDANSFVATVKMAESSVSGKEIERLVWTGDKRYARLTCTFEEATVEQVYDLFEKPKAGAVEKWGVARDRVRDLVSMITACSADIPHCSRVETVRTLNSTIEKCGAEINGIMDSIVRESSK